MQDIPMGGGINDSFGASQNSVAGAATDAQTIAAQIIQQAQQGPQNPIVNRPQVILPQPKLHGQIPYTPMASGDVQATTRAGQRRNDFNNMVRGVSNIVKAGINAKNAKSDRDIMHDLAIIQAASSNPDDPQNKIILDNMAKDPKVVKRLQKALGYNPLSGEPMPPEAKAMMKFQASQGPRQQAIQAAQQKNSVRNNPALAGGGGGGIQAPQGGQPATPQGGGQPSNTGQPTEGGGQPTASPQGGGAMQNLMSRMPVTQQINPIVSMQAELIKAGILAKNDLGPAKMLDYVTELMKNDTKLEELKQRAAATNNQTLGRLAETITRAQAMLKRGSDSDASRERVGAGHDAAYRYGADKRYAAAESKAMQTDKTFRNLKIASDSYDADIKRAEEQLSTLLKQKSTGTKETGADIDNQIILKKQEIEKYKSLKGTMEDEMKKRLNIDPPEGGVNNLLQEGTPSTEDMQFGDFVFPSGQQQ